ncbi:MAG: PD40 domain-containing protein [Gammaproteobacteria bacterium]|nr:PD40 domain-containing protein [Gammaproteobacteria bacterium]
MNGIATRFTLRAARALAAAMLCASWLAACSSGTSGGVSIGSGQAPDPATVDFPLAYVKRALPAGTEDARELRTFQAGADVWLRDRAAPDAPERNITLALTGGLWDVRDLDVSWDGNLLLFSMRRPPVQGAEESAQPTWNVYEYDRRSQQLRRVIASNLVAEEGHDVAPHYLPDGRIVFSSTRQRRARAILIDEGKPQFAALDEDRSEWAFNLHVMDADGGSIRQISFNQSHDLDPSVLNDGRIVFTRWENASGSSMHLYSVNPDGTGLALLYGANSHATGSGGSTVQFLQPRARTDGSLVALIRPFAGTEQGGDAVSIDAAHFVENAQPTLANAGLAGPAQAKITVNDVRTVPGLSPGGRYASLFPLWDGSNRLLVSWSLCRILQGGSIQPCTESNLAGAGALPAPPLYSVFMYDPRDRTQRPVLSPLEGTMFTDVVAMQPRTPLPPVIPAKVAGIDFDSDLAAEGVGILDILSVYDLDGTDTAPGGIVALRNPALATADQRPARFLRIEKAVSIPDDEVRQVPGAAFGAAGALGMREILGYAPIEPDGSVRIKVPADVAFAVSIVDRAGRRTSPRHLNWLQLRAGEVLTCNGCHRPAGLQPAGQPRISHGRPGLFARVNPGAPTTGQPFPNTRAALFADQGETMAQTRARISCQTDCAALTPSSDLKYEDVWTDPAAAGRPADLPFAYRYADLATPAPTSAACTPRWSAQCRATLHYPAHLAPLWNLPRPVLDAAGLPVLDGNGQPVDRNCQGCHSPRDAAGAVRVPAAQLDLSSTPSPEQSYQLTSYRELLFGDNAQQVDIGALRDILVPGPIDPVTGQPTLVPVAVAASMSSSGAGASSRFFSRFDPGGTHAGFLTDAELRLIAEWLDIGGQYYNDPFTAPEN